MNSRWICIVAGTVLQLLATSACAAFPRAEGTFERTLSVSGQVILDVSTGSGNIRVRTGGGGTVQVVGQVRARDDFRASAEEKVRFLAANPPIEQTGNTIRIGRVEDSKYRHNVSINYEIVTPADTRLTAGTGSGDLSVDGLRAPVDGKTGSGNIRMTGVGGDAHAQTGSGDIELDGVNGSVDLATGSGNVRAFRIGGSLKARTGSGDLRADFSAPGDVDLSTGSGSIDADGVRGALSARTGSGDIRAGGDPAGSWKVHSSSGSVNLNLAASAAFDLDARTNSGEITVKHPITMTGVVNRKAVKGRVRGGGTLIDVQTSSGNIVIQ